METTRENIQSLFADSKDYLKNKSELWKLKMIDKTSETVSSIVEKVIIFFIGIIFFILLNIAIALLIGYWLNHSFWGFFVLAGFYGIVGLVIHLSKDKLIKTPIINSLIQKFVK